MEGASAVDELTIDTRSFIEYDGWYQVEVRIVPRQAMEVEALDLLVDLRQQAGDKYRLPLPVDSLYVQRLGGGVDNTYQGGIPAKPGVHYRSTVLYPPTARTGPADVKKDWKSFAPICFMGNGDRGMWFFAWSDKGYVLKDDEAMLRVERLKDGTARLRVRLIAGPVTLDRPRKLTFALQPAPIKGNDPEYRTRITQIMHDTSGYRYYGDSVDAYALHTDRDYRELRKYLMYGNTLQAKEAGSRDGFWAGRLGKMLREGRADRIMMYGSQWMTGLGAEEFDSFGGEWLGRSNWRPKADMKFSDKWNYGHTVQWNTPRRLTPARVNWPQSMLDFFVWYHERLIDKSGFNGTWWDSCYSGTVTEYDPGLGRLDAKWNVIYRRQLCKRLNVVGWEHMRPPCWAMNTQVEMPWCQVYWLVKGFWGPSSQDISSIDHFGSLDFVRAALRPKSTTMTCKTTYFGHYRGSTAEKDRSMRRSADAILLVHDVQPHHDKELVHRLKYAVDYANTDQCLFMGYWLTGPVVQSAGRDVVAAVYQNPARRTAVLAFMNTWSRGQNLGGTTFELRRLIGARESVTLNRAYDLETDEPVRVMYDDGVFRLLDQLPIGRHNFRVVAVEAK